jgi:hypothetical protein
MRAARSSLKRRGIRTRPRSGKYLPFLLGSRTLLVWVGYEQATGWQIVDSADVESAV